MSNEQKAKDEFRQALEAAGLSIEGDPKMDGQLHRVPLKGGNDSSLDGAYVGHLDGKVPAGFIQNWKTGQSQTWSLEGVQLSREEQRELAVQAQLAQVQRAAERLATNERTAAGLQAKWETLAATPQKGSNAYLERKGVEAFGVRFERDRLLVPARDVEGKLWSLQTIPAQEGAKKLFAKGGRKAGNMHLIGEPKVGEPILVVEGYATGASVHMATAATTAVAFDSGNLDPVVAALKKRYPESPIVVLGDDDRLVKEPVVNPGVNKALQVAQKHDVGLVIPTFTNQGKLTDFNDLHQAEGLQAVKAQVNEALALTPAETRSHVQGRFPEVVEQLAQNAAQRPASQEEPSTKLHANERQARAPEPTEDVPLSAVTHSTSLPAGALATPAPERAPSVQPEPRAAAPAPEATAIDATGESARPTQPVAAADRAQHDAIEQRVHATLPVPTDAISTKDAREWVGADVAAYRAIGSADLQREAASAIGFNATNQLSYKAELDRQDPDLSKTAMAAYMDDAARLMGRQRATDFDQAFELSLMQERRAGVSLDKLEPAAQERLARQDLLSLHVLRDHAGEDSARQQVRDALQQPVYRATFEAENARLQLGISTSPVATAKAESPAAVGDHANELVHKSAPQQGERVDQRPSVDQAKPELQERKTEPANEAAAIANSITAVSRDAFYDDLAVSALRARLIRERAAMAEQSSRTLATATTAGIDKTAETLDRMLPGELKHYEQVGSGSLSAAEQLLVAAQKRIEGDLDIRAPRRPIVPLEDRFNVIPHFGRREYQFRDQGGREAFSEGWLSMRTSSDSAMVAAAMMDRADERGWGTVRSNGSAEFKRQLWIAAEARGIREVGHTPTAEDRVIAAAERSRLQAERARLGIGMRPELPGGSVALEPTQRQAVDTQAPSNARQALDRSEGGMKAPANDANFAASQAQTSIPTSSQAISKAVPSPIERALRGYLDGQGAAPAQRDAVATAGAEVIQGHRVHVGRILEMKTDHFEFDPKNKQSPYVRLEGAKGEQVVWGVDLPRAVEAAGAKVGDPIALEHRGAEPVVVSVVERDPSGQVVGTRDESVIRNSWFAITLNDLQRRAAGEVIRPPVGEDPLKQAKPDDKVAVTPSATTASSAVAAPSRTVASHALERAFDTAMETKKVPPSLRDALREHFMTQLAEREARGERFGVKVYDMTAERPPAPVPAATQTKPKHEQQQKRSGPKLDR